MKQSVLITGASGGFGKLITNKLLADGHDVIATMRDAAGKNSSNAEELRSSGAHIVEIDVTDDASVNDGVAAAIELTGKLDVVVNNAGVGVLGLQESFTPDDWKRLFEINVFGVQRVNRAVLPHMRERRQGLLVHISSLLGRMVLPFLGPYNSTKFALEALAENYRVELSGFGVESIIVEPGGYGTGFDQNLMTPTDDERAATYGDFAQAPMGLMESFRQNFEGDNAPDPQDVADAVAGLISKPAGDRPFRTVVDGLGMGAHIVGYNKTSEEITSGVYGAFGMADMLTLKR
jgi:NAD(P)-dependent dehydrogenase (short-subunit alcohol dehydrogenase family)